MFDIYFAGSSGCDFDEKMVDMGCCRLFSNLNDRKTINRHIDLIKGKDNKLFIDSGAFSVRNSNKFVDIDNYVSYINEIGEYITCFANLDVIPKSNELSELKRCAEAGFENFVYLNKHSEYADKLVGVFHSGEPIDILYKYIDYYKENNYLKFFALGNVVNVSCPYTKNFVIKYCDIIKTHLPTVKIHLFGYTRLDELPYIRCDSTDSTTWLKAAAYGNIITPYGQLNVSKRRSICDNSIHNFDTKTRNLIYNWIEDKGFDVEGIRTSQDKRVQFNVKYLLDYAKQYRYIQQTRKKQLI